MTTANLRFTYQELEALVDALAHYRRFQEAMDSMGHNEEEVSNLRTRLRHAMGRMDTLTY
jgi:hypothetical protein